MSTDKVRVSRNDLRTAILAMRLAMERNTDLIASLSPVYDRLDKAVRQQPASPDLSGGTIPDSPPFFGDARILTNDPRNDP